MNSNFGTMILLCSLGFCQFVQAEDHSEKALNPAVQKEIHEIAYSFVDQLKKDKQLSDVRKQELWEKRFQSFKQFNNIDKKELLSQLMLSVDYELFKKSIRDGKGGEIIKQMLIFDVFESMDRKQKIEYISFLASHIDNHQEHKGYMYFSRMLTMNLGTNLDKGTGNPQFHSFIAALKDNRHPSHILVLWMYKENHAQAALTMARSYGNESEVQFTKKLISLKRDVSIADLGEECRWWDQLYFVYSGSLSDPEHIKKIEILKSKNEVFVKSQATLLKAINKKK